MKRCLILLSLILLCVGCSNMSIKRARRILICAGEDAIVRGHMEREQGGRTHAESYFDEAIKAKMARNWPHIPTGSAAAVLAWILRRIHKRRKLEELIKDKLSGGNGHD